MKNKFKIFIFILMLVFVLPLSASATENHAPVYVGEKTQIELEKGKPFLITRDEISHWFKDEDGDSLSYWIKVNGSRYLEIEDRCVYYPETNEEVMFTFKANDGLCDSEEIDLPLTSVMRSVPSKQLLNSLIIHRSTAPVESTILLKNDNSLNAGQLFDPQKYEYILDGIVYDTELRLGFRATSDSTEDIVLTYLNNQTKNIKWSEGNGSVLVPDILTAGKNTLKIQAGENGQIYTIQLNVIPTLETLTTKGQTYWKSSFKSSKTEYTVEIAEDETWSYVKI